MTNDMQIAKNIIEKLHLHGNSAVIAGGAVRDILLKVEPKDIDIATSALPEQVEAIFKRTIPVGKQFGVIIVREHGSEFEVATFRQDSPEGDGRRPDSVTFSSMEEDAKRRDLSINGLFLDPVTGEIFDFVGGKKDLEDGRIRFIGDAQSRIDEDKLRMLRAVRFACRLGFTMDEDTKSVIRSNAHLIGQVSKERIKAELDKMLVCKKPSFAIEMLKEVGLLGHILPAVAMLWDCEQSIKWHSEGSVGIHTMMVLDATREKTDNVATLWSALLHDVGKPATSTLNEQGNISCHGHDQVGAEMADSIMRDMKSSTDERERVVALVGDHMRAGMTGDMRKSTLRRFVAQPHFDELLHLFQADCESSHPTDPKRVDTKLDGVNFLKDFVSTVEEVRILPPCFIGGKDLIEMGFKPSPLFKTILETIADMQLEGEINSVEEALEKVKELF